MRKVRRKSHTGVGMISGSLSKRLYTQRIPFCPNLNLLILELIVGTFGDFVNHFLGYSLGRPPIYRGCGIFTTITHVMHRFSRGFPRTRHEGLSTEELDSSAEKLVRAEKRNVALVIAHIAEMSRRKGHLERGYRNLFEYCTRRLHLSEGSVALRIQVANVSRRFPQILVALRPKPVFAPSIRKTPSQPSFTSPSKTPAVQETRRARPAFRTSPSILEPARPEVYNFRFAADRKFKEKFERLAEVLGVENPLQRMAEIMEQALDIALDKKDLQRKRARRLEKEAKRSGEIPSKKSRPDELFAREEVEKANSRYIPSEVRERVHERAGHQCEYRSEDGTRCRSRTGLEIEHQRPFALHHSHDERFLSLHCRSHNRLSAERVFGVAFI